MSNAAIVRFHIESELEYRVPSALTPRPKMVRPVVATGVRALDDLLHGGLPVGAITEMVGTECSGRTTLALSFLAQMTGEGKVCAWVDVSDSLDPVSAAAMGIDLRQLLWVRCEDTAQKKTFAEKPWSRLDRALRVTDLLLQGGGFGAIVLDMGSVSPEHALRVPLASWFRYRAAAEHGQVSLVLLTQHSCARSSAALVLKLLASKPLHERTVFTGLEYRLERVRERFQPSANPIPLRKSPQAASAAAWHGQTIWARQG